VILNILLGILNSSWQLLAAMSPYLLFGFLIAGVLNIYIPKEKIYKHLKRKNLKSVIKASIFGVPLPICSCGVIPLAAYLRKEGAGKGSTISFLSSTPTSGVDSILATYSLLGPLFAVIRPIAAFFSGILSGILVNISDKSSEKRNSDINTNSCNICNNDSPHAHTIGEKIGYIFRYAFVNLFEDVSTWIFIGIIAGGIIDYAIPTSFIPQYLGSRWLAYPLMLLISIPMYTCATGSIPIAASLIMKGMTPGAGLIFLITGPATNTATLSFVGGKLGKKTAFTYLLSIILTALIFGFILDSIWAFEGADLNLVKGQMKMLPTWIQISSAIILLGLMVNILRTKFTNYLKKGKQTRVTNQKNVKTFQVADMTCKHCVSTIRQALKSIPKIKHLDISLADKIVTVQGEVEKKQL